MATEETTEQKLARLEKEHQALKSQYDQLLASSQEEIKNLSAELSKAKTIADKAEPTVTVDKKEYSVIGQKFIYRRKGEVEAKEILVADLLKDKELQAELVKAGVGFLVLKK